MNSNKQITYCSSCGKKRNHLRRFGMCKTCKAELRIALKWYNIFTKATKAKVGRLYKLHYVMFTHLAKKFHITARQAKKYNRELCVHHIDYNKSNCNKNNLITVCNKCNIQANYQKDFWYAYYSYIIKHKR